jgi:BirA family transcriptional regulator, biotin operon repressor / biotin---[acetyl-CoA-carboxylase] ligase
MIPAIIRLPETSSTNSATIELLSKERPGEGSAIITDHQTDGRGIDTNRWESEKGMNLTFSLILYPTFTADHQFILNKAISLGIYDFLVAELPGHKVSIKWPNDIYIGNKKACGILIQNSVIGNKLDYVVVGIGLNVNQTHFRSNAPNPVSLKMISGKDYDLEEILQGLLQFVSKRYSLVQPQTFQEVENDYQFALYRRMEWYDYLLKGSKVHARITGTNAYGQLLLETKSEQIYVCDLKEVKFII